MKEKSAAVETLILMAKLFIICVIVAGLLAWINSMTSPVIASNEEKVFNETLSLLVEDAESFEKLDTSDYTPKENDVELLSLHKGIKGGKVCGYVASVVCGEGYGGNINVMVGVSSELEVTHIKIMSMSETAGLGAKAGTDEFQNQYAGLRKGITVEKNNGGSAEKNSISAISGATITSKAVTKAVNCALDAAEIGGAGNE